MNPKESKDLAAENKPFGKLRLSVKGTNNGSGFDILYDFGKSHNFVEFTSKSEFYFIQPWMQFPSKEYTDECMRVSIELVHRFNAYDTLKAEKESLSQQMDSLREYRNKLEAEIITLKSSTTKENKS